MKKKNINNFNFRPSSLNPRFLKSVNKNIDLRLNMSHIEPNQLEKKIKYIRKFYKKTYLY